MAEFADAGLLNLAGGCCGNTPDHIAAIAQAVARQKTARSAGGRLRLNRKDAKVAKGRKGRIMKHERLSEQFVQGGDWSAIEVHRDLGPACWKRAYEASLATRVGAAWNRFRNVKLLLPIHYKDLVDAGCLSDRSVGGGLARRGTQDGSILACRFIQPRF